VKFNDFGGSLGLNEDKRINLLRKKEGDGKVEGLEDVWEVVKV